MGRITLNVHTGPISLETEFVVIDVPSPYTAIMGRRWLHRLKAVPSSFHQKLRFPTDFGIMEIKGDQVASKQCIMAALEKARDTHTETYSSCEELDTVIFSSDPEKYFKIGRELSQGNRTELIDFLVGNVDVFAWDPYEVPGVDPNYIEHRLNTDPHSKPVQQKARRSAPVHAEAVQKEVEKLLQAGAIREIQYPTWLSNTVVVKKKNGKWRVCVDFTNLNQACPKDPFPLPKIDQLVDATAGHDRMSFLDAFQGYHQIALSAEDREKTAFITPLGIYCYKVMPFGLKNAGATYQRMVVSRPLKGFDGDIPGIKTAQTTIERFKMRIWGRLWKVPRFMVSHRGIEVNPDQIKVIQELKAPRTHKEVQRLTGMTAALSRFISRSADRCQPFFQLLKKSTTFKWDDKCVSAFEDLRYLSSFALVQPHTSLWSYRASHVLKADLQWDGFGNGGARFGNGRKILRGAIKGQVLADFVAEFAPTSEPNNLGESTPQEDSPDHTGWWKVYVDGASNSKGSGTGRLIVYCDSLLVASQINGEYMARDERMSAYLLKVQTAMTDFETVRIEQIGRNLNNHADALATLASVLSADFKRFIPIETLTTPSTDQPANYINAITVGPCWMDPYVTYLKEGVLPEQKKEAEIIRRKTARFWLSKDLKLYRRSFSGPYLLCVHPDVIEDLLYEIHEGICGSHTGGRSLAHRALTQGYWWPYMQKDAVDYVRKCDKCQRFSHSLHQPAGELQPLVSPWPFAQWGMDLVGPLPKQQNHPTEVNRGDPILISVYGSEAVIPLEIGLPTLRTSEWEPTRNDMAQSQALDLLEERREQAMIRLASYQQQLKKGYNKNIRPRSFQQGDLVLRKVLGNTKNPTDGKLGPNWEGPYRVRFVTGTGAYHLEDLNSLPLPRPWNVSNLRKYFH
uniref:Integrase zinc-binding domain-containing protein n=1 Tax=Fagus sylvatica TaxID=28930 RepID=A0A2N9EIF7_FAGSY